jgi:iron complex outermembrane recepter protein
MASTSCSLLLSSAGAGFAADAADQPRSLLEEIVVTAQRREERLQDVPLSVTAVTGETLTEGNVNSLEHLSHRTPSVHVGAGGTRTSYLTIRGIGSGNNQAFDQAVGMFVDEIYHGRSRVTAASFLDLERLEVLKGPQSTFFGNNVIAGAFNMTTRKPSFDPNGYVRALYGEYGQYALEGAAGGAITDTLAFRVAASSNGQDGWVENVVSGDKLPKQDNMAGRISLAYQPTDSLDVILKAERTTSKSKGGLDWVPNECPPTAPFAAAGFCAVAVSQGLPGDVDDLENSSGPDARGSFDTNEYLLAINYEVADHNFTSITGYHEYDQAVDVDNDFLPSRNLQGSNSEQYDQFSQELRVVSPAGRRFEYVVGAYYQTDQLTFQQEQVFFINSLAIPNNPALASLVPYLPLGNRINFDQDEKSYAVFGSLAWNITDDLKLTGGLRRTWVEKDSERVLFIGTGNGNFGDVTALPDSLQPLAGTLGFGVPGTLAGDRDDDDLLPSVKIQYQIQPDMMVYASYSEGFKAGGFNGVDTSGTASRYAFDPESVAAYEVGLKSQLFDRVLLNIAVFHSDYEDLQVSVSERAPSGASISVVNNAGRSRTRGVELETEWAVTDALRLSLNASYLDSEYQVYQNVAQTIFGNFCRGAGNAARPECMAEFGGAPPATQNLAGRPTLFAPEWSGSVVGSYRFDLPNGLALTPEIAANFSTDYYNEGTLDPLLKDDGYVKWDARITLAPEAGGWAVDLIGKNLSDEKVRDFGAPWPTSPGSYLVGLQPPRSVAVQLRMDW